MPDSKPDIRAGEFDLIQRYFAPLVGEGAFGLKDDAAILTPPDGDALVVTQDAILEGVHFLSSHTPEEIAHRAYRTNVSDIISKGATPFAYSLAVGLPTTWNEEAVSRFATALAADQKTYGAILTGGDTYTSPDRLCVSITMFGAVKQERYRSRLGAEAGDIILVSGTIGDAALGLLVDKDKSSFGSADEALRNAYRIPNPPAALAPVVAHFATASMDVSDGLIGDLRKLTNASGVTAELKADGVPFSDAVQEAIETNVALLETALTGGDDYQALFTVHPDNMIATMAAARDRGVRLTPIGEISAGNGGEVVVLRDGVPLSFDRDSYSHF